MGTSTPWSQAFGAGQREDCHRSLVIRYLSEHRAHPHPVAAPVWLLPKLLRSMQIDPAITRARHSLYQSSGGRPFPVAAVLRGMLPLPPGHEHGPHRGLFRAFGHHRQHHVNATSATGCSSTASGARPCVWAPSAPVWSTAPRALVHGRRCPVPSSIFCGTTRRHRTDLAENSCGHRSPPRIRRLLTPRLPRRAAIHYSRAVSSRSSPRLIARLGPVPSRPAHQIALNTVAFTYMVPLGIIFPAAAVRVGQAIGRKDPRAAGDARQHRNFSGSRVHDLCQRRFA